VLLRRLWLQLPLQSAAAPGGEGVRRGQSAAAAALRYQAMPLVLYQIATGQGLPIDAEPFAFRYNGAGELDLATLRRAFPERGEFHFRAKTRHEALRKVDYVWADLVKDDDVVPRDPQGGPPHVLALPINYDSEEEEASGEEEDRATSEEDEGEPLHGSAWDMNGIHAALPPAAPEPTHSRPSTAPAPRPARDSPAPITEYAEDDIDMFFSGGGGGGGGADFKPPLAVTRSASHGQRKTSTGQESEASSSDESDSSSSESSSEDEGEDLDLEAAARAIQQQEEERRQRRLAQEGSGSAASVGSSGGYLGSFAGATGFKSAAFGSSVGSFLKKSAAAAIQFAGGVGAVPSRQERGVLGRLATMLNEPFQEDRPEHLQFLKDCWKGAFPAEAFCAEGPQWQILGFDSDNPARSSLLDNAGVLGLWCLAYHLEHEYGRSQPVSKASIDFAPSTEHAVKRLTRLFGITDRSFEQSSRPYWAIFDSGAGAFCEVVSFTLQRANAMRGGSKSSSDVAAIDTAVQQVESVLEQAPRSIDAFYQAARSLALL